LPESPGLPELPGVEELTGLAEVEASPASEHLADSVGLMEAMIVVTGTVTAVVIVEEAGQSVTVGGHWVTVIRVVV
jgi:hypothetical protein